MKLIGLLLLPIAVLVGCQAPTPVVTGGSRADGTVDVTWVESDLSFQPPDFSIADSDALRRCQAWGYSDIEPFHGHTEVCLEGDKHGCYQVQKTRTYQCLGQPN